MVSYVVFWSRNVRTSIEMNLKLVSHEYSCFLWIRVRKLATLLIFFKFIWLNYTYTRTYIHFLPHSSLLKMTFTYIWDDRYPKNILYYLSRAPRAKIFQITIYLTQFNYMFVCMCVRLIDFINIFACKHVIFVPDDMWINALIE